MGINSDTAAYFFLALGIALIGLNLLIVGFLSMIYVPKIRKEIENLLNIMSQNWIELQLITSFAYVEISLTEDVTNMLTANNQWIFFNFLDTFYGSVLHQNTNDTGMNYWSKSAFKNVYTITLFIILYLISYAILKLCFKKSTLLSFFEFEIAQHLMKIFIFRVGMSLFLEIDDLFNGGTADYNTGIICFYGCIFFAVYPLAKIIYLRLKYRGNLDSSNILRIFGRDFRDYQICWREFHILTEQSLQLIIAGALIFIDTMKAPQSFTILAALGLFFAYSVIFKPYRYKILNMDAWCSRGLLTGMMGIILGSYYYSSLDFLNYGILLSLVLWYTEKLCFNVYHIYSAFGAVKALMDKEQPIDGVSPSLLNEETDDKKKKRVTIKRKNSEKNAIEDENTIVTTGRPERDESPEYEREGTANNSVKQRIKRGVTIESTPDSIDPRLSRNRTSRKRKTIGK